MFDWVIQESGLVLCDCDDRYPVRFGPRRIEFLYFLGHLCLLFSVRHPDCLSWNQRCQLSHPMVMVKVPLLTSL